MNEDEEKDLFGQLIFSGDIEKVKEYILKGVDLNKINSNGMIPLIFAVEGDQPKMLELLLKNGANPNIKSNISGTTALHWAIEYANDGMNQSQRSTPFPEPLECIRILLRYGADKTSKDDNQKTPLEYNRTEIIRDMIINYNG